MPVLNNSLHDNHLVKLTCSILCHKNHPAVSDKALICSTPAYLHLASPCNSHTYTRKEYPVIVELDHQGHSLVVPLCVGATKLSRSLSRAISSVSFLLSLSDWTRSYYQVELFAFLQYSSLVYLHSSPMFFHGRHVGRRWSRCRTFH